MEYDTLKQPDRITHEYNMLMSSMHVSVGKHLLDPYFTVIWANDFFYEKTGYGREEYEATFHNHVSEYYSAFPDVYETMGKFIKTALKHGEPSYEFVCPMPVKGGSGRCPVLFGQLGFRAQPAGPERTLPGHAGRQAGAFHRSSEDVTKR